MSAKYELVEDWPATSTGPAHRRGADVAVDSYDQVYLLTRDESRVTVFTPDGELVRSWTDRLIGPGAHGIAVDGSGNVFVVDWLEHCVCKYTCDGVLDMVLGVPGLPSNTGIELWPPAALPYPVGRLGSLRAGGPFNGPTKLAIGARGDLYVSDGYGNARVHHFSASGVLLASWGRPGMGEGEFHNPHSIHITSEGLLYVCDRENDRIQVFTTEFSFVRAFEVQRPVAAAVDRDGRIAVASLRYEPGDNTFTRGRVHELVPDRLSVLNAEGTVLFQADGVIRVPNGIAVDSYGDIYVAEVGQAHALNSEVAEEAEWIAALPSRPNGDVPGAPVSKFRRRR